MKGQGLLANASYRLFVCRAYYPAPFLEGIDMSTKPVNKSTILANQLDVALALIAEQKVYIKKLEAERDRYRPSKKEYAETDGVWLRGGSINEDVDTPVMCCNSPPWSDGYQTGISEVFTDWLWVNGWHCECFDYGSYMIIPAVALDRLGEAA